MFQPNWPTSCVQVVVIKESAAHCKAVYFSYVVASDYYYYYYYYYYLIKLQMGFTRYQ
jgi:hypothetical protein